MAREIVDTPQYPSGHTRVQYVRGQSQVQLTTENGAYHRHTRLNSVTVARAFSASSAAEFSIPSQYQVLAWVYCVPPWVGRMLR